MADGRATPGPAGGPPGARPVDDAQAFWRSGPLPGPPGPAPGPAAGPAPEEGPPTGLDLVGRPEITVAGRNLADLLRPVYTALTRDPP